MIHILTMRSTQWFEFGTVFLMKCGVAIRFVLLGCLLLACGRSHEVTGKAFTPDAGPGNEGVPFIDACAQKPLLRSDAITASPQFERFGDNALWVTGGHGDTVVLDLNTVEPIEVPDGNIVGRDARNGLVYIDQRSDSRLMAWQPGSGLQTYVSTQDGLASVAVGQGGAWFCRFNGDHPTETTTLWFDALEGTSNLVGHTNGCELQVSKDGAALTFVDRRDADGAVLEYADWPAVVMRGDQRVELDTRASAYESEESHGVYHISSDGKFVVRLIAYGEPGQDRWLPEFDVYSARTGAWLATQALTAASDDVSLRILGEDQATIIEHDHGTTVVRVASDEAILDELRGESFIASEGSRLYTWREDQLLLRAAVTGKHLDGPRVVYENVELAQLRSQNTQLITALGGSLVLQDRSMRIITDLGQSMTDVETARSAQVMMFGRWSATTVISAKWNEDEPGYSRRVYLSDGRMLRELDGLYPAIESNERIITRENERLFIWNPQSGNETTLATLGAGPIEVFALEDRDELVVATGCLEPETELNDFGPIYDWSFSKVSLPTQRFENGGS